MIALGCTAVQSVSEQAVQQKLAKITLGLTTKEEIETLFGKDHTTENASWSYSFSDRAFVVSQSPRVGLSGLFPITAATESTNTRAFVTVRFNKHQTVSTLEVHRFFNTPFVNNYSYLLDRTTDVLWKPLGAQARQATSAFQSSTNQLGAFCCSRTLRATLRLSSKWRSRSFTSPL